MANDVLYGTDVQALTDLPDPEVLCSGDTAVAYAIARRLANPSDSMQEIGDNNEYDAIDLQEWLGGDFDLTDRNVIDDLQQQATQVILKDPRVLSVSVRATYATGTLTVNVVGQGADGPFGFILPVTSDGVQAPFTDILP